MDLGEACEVGTMS